MMRFTSKGELKQLSRLLRFITPPISWYSKVGDSCYIKWDQTAHYCDSVHTGKIKLEYLGRTNWPEQKIKAT
jgi:hypothetical protein